LIDEQIGSAHLCRGFTPVKEVEKWKSGKVSGKCAGADSKNSAGDMQ
jgi:hypothetical protein